LRCASCGEILPPPSLLAKFYLVSAFLNIVRTSATASFEIKFHFRPQPVFNRAVRFVMNFAAVRDRFDHRLFIAKRPLKTKPVTRYAALLVLVSEPQILNLTRAALRQNFAEILFAAL